MSTAANYAAPLMVGVKFILTDASFLTVLVPLQRAIEIVQGWGHGTLPAILSHLPETGGMDAWAVRVADVVAIHTTDPRMTAPQGQAAPPVNASGIPTFLR